MPYMFDIDFILLQICNNSFVKWMFKEYSTYYVSKKPFWAFTFLLRQGQDFLLEIHN